MKTLEEIREIIYPNVESDLVEVAKDLLVQKYGEGKLVTFDEVPLYYIGDPMLSLIGLAVVNNQLISVTRTVYGGDSGTDIIGTAYIGYGLSNEGIGIPNMRFLDACQKLFENGKYVHLEFDFSTMKSTDDDWRIDPDYYEENLIDNKEFLKLLDGEKGYVEL